MHSSKILTIQQGITRGVRVWRIRARQGKNINFNFFLRNARTNTKQISVDALTNMLKHSRVKMTSF